LLGKKPTELPKLNQRTPTEFLFATTDFNRDVTARTADRVAQRRNGRRMAAITPGLEVRSKRDVLGQAVVVVE